MSKLNELTVNEATLLIMIQHWLETKAEVDRGVVATAVHAENVGGNTRFVITIQDMVSPDE